MVGVIIQSVLYGYGPSCILGASIGVSNEETYQRTIGAYKVLRVIGLLSSFNWPSIDEVIEA